MAVRCDMDSTAYLGDVAFTTPRWHRRLFPRQLPIGMGHRAIPSVLSQHDTHRSRCPYQQMITSTLAAYAFARLHFRFKNTLFVLYLLQIIIPNEVLIFPNYQTLSHFSLVDTLIGIMIPYFLSAFGVFLLRQTFQGVPLEIEEAARLDGCNTLQLIWHFYVPLAKPTYVAFALVSASHQWSNFLWPLVMTNSPENRSLSLGMSLFAKTTESSAQWGQLSAATMLVIAPLLIAFFIFQRQFISSFMMSGIK